MNDKILIVDDDPNLRASYERIYRRQFRLETADGGESGLARLAAQGPYAVVVADRQMPRMDGIEFLTRVKKQAPDTVRMMLTGNADLEGAIRVMNDGGIFRFLTKPCPPEVFSKAIIDAQNQYRLVTGEKELLEKTLSGSIKLLTDILSSIETQSFGRTQTLRDAISSLTSRLGVSNAWAIHLAVMLAPIGQVTIPPETLVKARAGQSLSETEKQLWVRVPEIASRLLANIPRLEEVARIVLYQNKHFDGSGFPTDSVSGEAIPVGARLLKILLDLMELQGKGLGRMKALQEMEQRQGWYDPAFLVALRKWEEGAKPESMSAASLSVPVDPKHLVPGMVLRSNVYTADGVLILSAGHEINEMTLEKIRNFSAVTGIKEPILVQRDACCRSDGPG